MRQPTSLRASAQSIQTSIGNGVPFCTSIGPEGIHVLDEAEYRALRDGREDVALVVDCTSPTPRGSCTAWWRRARKLREAQIDRAQTLYLVEIVKRSPEPVTLFALARLRGLPPADVQLTTVRKAVESGRRHIDGGDLAVRVIHTHADAKLSYRSYRFAPPAGMVWAILIPYF